MTGVIGGTAGKFGMAGMEGIPACIRLNIDCHCFGSVTCSSHCCAAACCAALRSEVFMRFPDCSVERSLQRVVVGARMRADFR